MTQTDYDIIKALLDDPKIGTVIGRILLITLVVSIILERNTKIKPWTRLMQWIGKTANAQIIAHMDQIDTKIDQLQRVQEATKAQTAWRWKEQCRRAAGSSVSQMKSPTKSRIRRKCSTMLWKIAISTRATTAGTRSSKMAGRSWPSRTSKSAIGNGLTRTTS